MTFLTFPKGFFGELLPAVRKQKADLKAIERERISGTIGTAKNLKNSSITLDQIKLPTIISITKKMCN